MKKILTIVFFISALNVFSQKEIKWYSNFDEAAKIAKKTHKPILANFTGSDWCGWCKILKRDVFVTDEFKKWANKNVVLLEVDFPKRKQLSPEMKKQNYALQKAFGVRGYPTVWLFNVGSGKNPKKDLTPLGKTGYVRGGVNAWIASVDKFLP